MGVVVFVLLGWLYLVFNLVYTLLAAVRVWGGCIGGWEVTVRDTDGLARPKGGSPKVGSPARRGDVAELLAALSEDAARARAPGSLAEPLLTPQQRWDERGAVLAARAADAGGVGANRR